MSVSPRTVNRPREHDDRSPRAHLSRSPCPVISSEADRSADQSRIELKVGAKRLCLSLDGREGFEDEPAPYAFIPSTRCCG
jgi:hypothetical protein